MAETATKAAARATVRTRSRCGQRARTKGRRSGGEQELWQSVHEHASKPGPGDWSHGVRDSLKSWVVEKFWLVSQHCNNSLTRIP